MAETKKLYLNGKLVGEFESTGDIRRDSETVTALLREKGLYQEQTLERSIFGQAVAFATTSSYLYKRDLTTTPTNGVSIAPFVVNAAFALELYLKTLGHLHGQTLRGHDLLELFDALPKEAHKALLENFAQSTWPCGITELGGFRSAVEDLRRAFVEWRYLHEENPTKEVRFAPMIFVMEVLHNTCRAYAKLQPIRNEEIVADPAPRNLSAPT